MVFAIKTEVRDLKAHRFAFKAQKTMYGGKKIATGDTIQGAGRCGQLSDHPVGDNQRGPSPGYYPLIYGVNNLDEFCYEGVLYDGNLSTSPHLFSNLHGAVVNDVEQYQWGGGINDAGTLVWAAPANSLSPTWEIFEATWISSPALTVVSGNFGLALEWPTNASAFHVQYAPSLAPAIFRLSNSAP